MEFDDGMLIDLVRQFPELYDKGNSLFKDKNFRENAWQTIASTLNVDVKCAQTRWTVLRNRFSVERKREKTTPSGSGARKTWALYSALSFLDNYMAMRKTVGNIHKPTEDSQPASTSACSSLHFILEDNAMCAEDIQQMECEVIEEPNEMLQVSDSTDKENSIPRSLSEQETISSLKNDTPTLRKKRKKSEDANVMTKLSSAFDNFNEFMKNSKKETAPTDLEQESVSNFVKSVGNDLMQIRNKKIRYAAEIDIMKVVKNALQEDMSE